jgi:hypothetical protein
VYLLSEGTAWRLSGPIFPQLLMGAGNCRPLQLRRALQVVPVAVRCVILIADRLEFLVEQIVQQTFIM